jgi:predicted DNA-binding ribbon-helix-helix protein
MKGWLWIKIERRVLEALKGLDQGNVEEVRGLLVSAEATLVELAKHPLSLEEAEELARLGRKIPQVLETLDRGEIEEARALLVNLASDLRVVVDHALLSEEVEEEEGEGEVN